MDETSSSYGSKKFFSEEKKISMDYKLEKINKNKQLKCRIESFHNLIKFPLNFARYHVIAYSKPELV